MKEKWLEIHEIYPEYLEHDYKDIDVFSFDDCLFSEYQYIEFFEQFNKPLVFFWSTGIYNHGEKQIWEYCDRAHRKAIVDHDFSGYMTIEQIIELSKKHTIGYHGVNHVFLDNLSFVKQMSNCFKETKGMIADFKKYNIQTNLFCPPYNDVSQYPRMLNEFAPDCQIITGRISIEEYLGKEERPNLWKNYIMKDDSEECRLTGW